MRAFIVGSLIGAMAISLGLNLDSWRFYFFVIPLNILFALVEFK